MRQEGSSSSDSIVFFSLIYVEFTSEQCRPLTLSLAMPSFGNKSAKSETMKAFLSLSRKHIEGFLSKCTVLKVDLLQGHQIYCLQACMCALFSLEILHPGTVKGLNSR